ncbi:hypothetical protein [Chryseobacterium viscerum]|uniref:hypothetical protein n=1 Tax=Chryseobacterium TaxID=59732 RepID=UPI0006482DE6|nr:hypothetical protein [Chryseobacterium viscerum]MCW1963983.1 hypothetical protein [Chryseobacterium viscerum]WPO90307.1 hypothetical protein SFA27_19045 [Chryseobacterium sp. HR92]
MKIINKYPVFSDIIQLGDTSFQFKFKKSKCFDHAADLFVVNIQGVIIQNVEEWISAIKADHINMNSVITVDGNAMEIFTGNFDEDQWGDWCTSFSPFVFESYDTKYIQKEQKDWDDELLLTVRMQVMEKMCRSVTASDFRKFIQEYCEADLSKAELKTIQRERLKEILEKINKLNASSFYDIFVWKSTFQID